VSTELPPTSSTEENDFRIGPYRVLRHVAQGGMGAVYRVEDPESGDHFAMKLASTSGIEDERFARIHQVLRQFDHPGIVRSRACGCTEDGRTYHLLDFVGGSPAQVFAKSMGVPGTAERTTAVITVAIHLAEALAFLHEQGVIHRDVKSANVMVRDDRSACLIDFGSSVMPGLPATPGHFVGTYTYASPEQIQGQVVDARTDIYAMGILLYRMLAGRRPFSADDKAALIEQHLHQIPVPVDQYVEGVPTKVVQLLNRMLEKDRTNRPQSAIAVADTLRQS
jgi:serine/threonine protein kinase